MKVGRTRRCSPFPFWLAGLLTMAMFGVSVAFAQSSDFELPPAEKLVIDLANADVRISWCSGPKGHAKARPARPPEMVADEDPGSEAGVGPGAALELRQAGSKVELWRSPEAGGVRLQVEIVVGGTKALHLQGNGLDLTVTAPFENGRRIPAAQTFLLLQGSNADLTMLVAGKVHASNSRIVSRQSLEDLEMVLVGGGSEIESHQGKLLLKGKGAEFLARGAEGEITVDLKAGRCELLQSHGKLEGTVSAGAALMLTEWSGEANLVASGANLDLRNFWPEPQVLRLKTAATAVAIEGLETAQVELELEGGSLRMNDLVAIEGKIATNLETKVEIRRIVGSWTGLFQDSEVYIENADRPTLELYNGQIEIEGIEELSLIAHGSKILATEIGHINSLNMVTSEGEFGLLEGGRAEVMVQGLSTAIFNLPSPCLVTIPPPSGEGEDASWLEVSGCTQGEELAEEGASVLSGALGGNSRVEARAAF